MWTIAVRAARPAIVAAAVLATARALGEAIMLSMVSGSVGFAPNPLDGLTFFFEPTRPLAATIVDNAEGLSVEAVRPDALRVRGGPAGLERSSSRFAGWARQAAAASATGWRRLMAAPRPQPRPPPARRRRGERLLAAAATASASALCWAAGHRCSA